MKRKIRFSLLYRDMWQSSGKYQPSVEQLKAVAPHIIEMGCFDRIETNGGAFEQVQLLFGENPNTAVREWTRPFNEAGIETHMLERALNGGAAKTRFENELAKAREQFASPTVVQVVTESASKKPETPVKPKQSDPALKLKTAPSKGKIYFNLYGELTEPSKHGDHVDAGERICYIQTSTYIDEINSPWKGEVSEIVVAQVANVNKGDFLFKIKEQKRKKSKKKLV